MRLPTPHSIRPSSFFFSGLVPDRRSHIHTSYTQGGAAQACAPARNCLFVFLLPRRIKSQGACVHECVRVRAGWYNPNPLMELRACVLCARIQVTHRTHCIVLSYLRLQMTPTPPKRPSSAGDAASNGTGKLPPDNPSGPGDPSRQSLTSSEAKPSVQPTGAKASSLAPWEDVAAMARPRPGRSTASAFDCVRAKVEDEQCGSGWTALHWGAYRGNTVALTGMLVDGHKQRPSTISGALVIAVCMNRYGLTLSPAAAMTPILLLMCARPCLVLLRAECVQALLNASADPNLSWEPPMPKSARSSNTSARHSALVLGSSLWLDGGMVTADMSTSVHPELPAMSVVGMAAQRGFVSVMNVNYIQITFGVFRLGV
jgi:hypothetical protein